MRVTPPLIAALLVVIDWRGSFVILGMASLLWLVVWAWYFRNDPREHPVDHRGGSGHAARAVEPAAGRFPGCGWPGACCR